MLKLSDKWVPMYMDVRGLCVKIMEEALRIGAIAPETRNGSTHALYIACFPTLSREGFFTEDGLTKCVRHAVIKTYTGYDARIHIGDRHRVRAHAYGFLASGGVCDLKLERATFVRADTTPWFKMPEGAPARIHVHKVQAISIPR